MVYYNYYNITVYICSSFHGSYGKNEIINSCLLIYNTIKCFNYVKSGDENGSKGYDGC